MFGLEYKSQSNKNESGRKIKEQQQSFTGREKKKTALRLE